MTEITDAEVAEIQWASSEQGKAAHKAAWQKLREMGLHQYVDATQLGQIVYAAYLAAGWDAEMQAEGLAAADLDERPAT